MGFTVETNIGEAEKKLAELSKAVSDTTPMMKEVAAILEHDTETNFEVQGRPHWVPLSKATIENRRKGKGGSSVLKILKDSGTLADSINSSFGADYALVGSNVKYAAIHQFGGQIEHPARQQRVRLRTNQDGSLTRQKGNKNLARFAKEEGDRAHKRYRESWHQVDAYTTNIPARPYLPFTGTPQNIELQPETGRSILEALEKMISRGF